MAISLMDEKFNTAAEITYLTCLKLNALNAFLFIVTSIFLAITIGNMRFGISDKVYFYIVVTITFIIMFLIKSALIQGYGLKLSGHFFVTLGGLILLAVPYYFPYRVLEGMKMAP